MRYLKKQNEPKTVMVFFFFVNIFIHLMKEVDKMFTMKVKEGFKSLMSAIALIAMMVCVFEMYNMNTEAVLSSFVIFMIGAHFVDAEDQ